MCSVVIPKWIVISHLIMVPLVNLQMPVPLYPMMSAMYAVPITMNVPDRTTTTTTEQSIPVAMHVPVPFPVQFAVPAMPPPMFCHSRPRPNNCPQCPPCLCTPSCTPSFFSYCSPCHQKCRCRSSEDAPAPLPPRPPIPLPGPAYPMPVPMPSIVGSPPLVVIPFPPPGPPRFKQPRRPSSRDDDSSSDTSLSSSSSEYCSRKRRRKKKGHFKRKHIYRRNFESSDVDTDNDLVKPVLTYISENGDVKFRKRLSNDEASELINDRTQHQTVQVVAGGDSDNKPMVSVISQNPERTKSNHRFKQVVLKRGTSQNVLGEGKKQIIFRPPPDKTITNLSVSFAIV